MNMSILGIDVAKLKFDVALLSVGDKFRHKVFPNTPSGFAQLGEWLKKQQVTHVHACLEATGTYGEALALYLHEAGHVVSVARPGSDQSICWQSTITHEDGQGRRFIDRALLSHPATASVGASGAGSAGVTSTCAAC